MRKSSRSSHAFGGSTAAMETAKGRPQAATSGGLKNAPSERLGKGNPVATRSGNRRAMPSQALSLGRAEASKMSGPNSRDIALGRTMGRIKGAPIARQLANGKALGVRSGEGAREMAAGKVMGRRGNFATGGHATDPGFMPKGKKLELARKRDAILEQPGYKKGGRTKREHHFLGGLSGLGMAGKNMPQSQMQRMQYDWMGKPHPVNPFGPQIVFKEGGNVKRAGGRAKKREHHEYGGSAGYPQRPIPQAIHPQGVQTDNGDGSFTIHYPDMGVTNNYTPPKSNNGGGHNPNFWDGFKSGFGGVFKGIGSLFGLAEGGEVSVKALKKAMKSHGIPVNNQKAMFEALHSNFSDKPLMRKLRASKKEVYEGEPHRASRRTSRRSSGGRMLTETLKGIRH